MHVCTFTDTHLETKDKNILLDNASLNVLKDERQQMQSESIPQKFPFPSMSPWILHIASKLQDSKHQIDIYMYVQQAPNDFR